MLKNNNKAKSAGQIFLIPQNEIDPNPNQPRKHFDFDELESLAQSIRQNGLLQPITVRKTESERYELIAGERRLRAARLIGMVKIPAIVLNMDEKSSALFSILENLQRENLSFFEEAEAVERLLLEYNMSQEDVAKKLGKAQSTISNKLRLLKLSPEMRLLIAKGGLTERHARAILTLKNDVLRERALGIILDRRLNVAESEKLIAQMQNKQKGNQNNLRGIRDVRMFINTLNHAVDAIRRAGVDADAAKSETEEYIEYVVRIPKLEQLKLRMPVDDEIAG